MSEKKSMIKHELDRETSYRRETVNENRWTKENHIDSSKVTHHYKILKTKFLKTTAQTKN